MYIIQVYTDNSLLMYFIRAVATTVLFILILYIDKRILLKYSLINLVDLYLLDSNRIIGIGIQLILKNVPAINIKYLVI